MVKANRKSRRAAERKDHLPVNDNEPRLDLKALVPVKVSDAMTAFPARVLPLMPPWEAIPDEFKDDSLSSAVGRKWRQFQTTWFFSGLAGVKFGRWSTSATRTRRRRLRTTSASRWSATSRARKRTSF